MSTVFELRHQLEGDVLCCFSNGVSNTQPTLYHYHRAAANWFSYTLDFVSQNWEIERAIRITHALFPHLPVRLVGDSGLDDQKFFRLVQRLPQTHCIFRAQHNRWVEVYNQRLDRWEREQLFDLAACAYLPVSFQTTFTHARNERLVTVHLGWFQVRFADLPKPMWALIARRDDEETELVLLTTIPITNATEARLAYEQWRLRPAIEHTYRFDQEQGLDVEDMRVRSLEAMRRLFVLVLLTALFVAYLAASWPQPAVCWLRSLERCAQVLSHVTDLTARSGACSIFREAQSFRTPL